MAASKHYGVTREHWSFVITMVTDVTCLRLRQLADWRGNHSGFCNDSGNLSDEPQ